MSHPESTPARLDNHVPEVSDEEHEARLTDKKLTKEQVAWVLRTARKHQQLRTGQLVGSRDYKRAQRGLPAVVTADAGERRLADGAIGALTALVDPQYNIRSSQIIPVAAKLDIDPEMLWSRTVRATLGIAHPHPGLRFSQPDWHSSDQEQHQITAEEAAFIGEVARDENTPHHMTPRYPAIDLAARGINLALMYNSELRGPLEEGSTPEEVLGMWAAANTDDGPVGLMRLPDPTVSNFAALARAAPIDAPYPYLQLVEEVGRQVASRDWRRHDGEPIGTRGVSEGMARHTMVYLADKLHEWSLDPRYSDATRLRTWDQRQILNDHFGRTQITSPIGYATGITAIELEQLAQKPLETPTERNARTQAERDAEDRDREASARGWEKLQARQKGVDEGKRWPTFVTWVEKKRGQVQAALARKEEWTPNKMRPSLASAIEPGDIRTSLATMKEEILPAILPEVASPGGEMLTPREAAAENTALYLDLAQQVYTLGEQPQEPSPLQGPRNIELPRAVMPRRLTPGQTQEAVEGMFRNAAEVNPQQTQAAEAAAARALELQRSLERGQSLILEQQVSPREID